MIAGSDSAGQQIRRTRGNVICPGLITYIPIPRRACESFDRVALHRLPMRGAAAYS